MKLLELFINAEPSAQISLVALGAMAFAYFVIKLVLGKRGGK